MFTNQTAWFSSSVPTTRQDIWAAEDGFVVGWRTANYLFSEDAACPDTLEIFQSEDYLWNRVVVFHSLYLSVCEKRESVKSVAIGHYVLPPVSVQEEVRNAIGGFIWEDDQSVTENSCNTVSSKTEEDRVPNRSNTEQSDTGSSDCTFYSFGNSEKSDAGSPENQSP